MVSLNPKSKLIAGAMAFALFAGASSVSAQECTANVSPQAVKAGAQAAEVTVTLDAPIGAIRDLQAPEGSGIALAAPTDVPRTDMAADETPRPIAMGDDPSSWTIWLATNDAKPGVYRIVFDGTEGQCEGEIQIEANN